MSQNSLKKPAGATKQKKMVGRGNGSGHGVYSCRGIKGQKSRKSGNVRPGFEGGQMPLYRRLARRGFSNAVFKVVYDIVNIADIEKKFKAGDKITKADLVKHGLIKKTNSRVKLLGNGELTKKVSIEVDKASAKAFEAFKKAGGEIIEIKKNKKVEKNG
ncbi:MAG: 50S ribosomal protein L15 [Spirochaetales bacterium]|nr:50S ribosomal protein L15 [Spirochaetales bacterium]